MSAESRRTMIAKLITSEGLAGRPISEDRDFLSLAERWIGNEIEMAEMCRLYRLAREERRRHKLYSLQQLESSILGYEPMLSSEGLLTELARMTRPDVDRR